METLKFKPHLCEQILSGKKTLTWRLFDDKNLQVGDKLEFVNSETGEAFVKAELTDVTKKRLGDVSDEDYEGHERYESEEELLKTYKGYYGDEVTLDTELKVIKFKLRE